MDDLSLDEDDGHFQENLQDEVVQEVLKTGTDLRQYSKQIEKDLKEVENKSIQDYIKESQNIASLHNQIQACDSILERMESMLLSFQSDLGSISSEILSLQRKSISMSLQLNNRQAVKGPLSQFIDDMAIPESLIIGICDSNVTDKEFLTQLESLNHKMNFVKEQSIKESKSCHDVRDNLEKLKIKAVAKIRSYLLEQIYKFRKPMSNYHIPQNAMLKHKFLFEFVLTHERLIAQEVCNEYVDTMSKIYLSYFKTYSSRLAKLQYEEAATKDDLMGVEDPGSNRGLFHKANLKHKATVFTIGNRGEVLTSQLESPILVPHSASKNEVRYPYEALFRSEQYALVDNACREYLFLSEFFMLNPAPALEMFNQIMGRTLSLFIKTLESFIQDCYDAIALILCVHLIMRYQLICHKRAVPALDRYWETLQAIIWPRFEYILRLNIQSIKDCDPTKFNKEMKPHYITRRYAEFSAAIVGISENFPDELVNRLLAELQEEVEYFILRMAAIFPERKEQLIFLINNYDMVLGVLMERTRDNSKEADSFREQLNSRSAEYVEEILSPYFGGIMQFVKEEETMIEKGQSRVNIQEFDNKSLHLVNAFNSTWKQSMEHLNKEVALSFSNLIIGSSLLQLALSQLLQYYQRFHKILSLPIRNQLVNKHHIIVEIKKYKNTITGITLNN